MFKKVWGAVKWVVDTGISLLPYIGDFKHKKALQSVMLAVQAFGKNEPPEKKWETLKDTVKNVSKEFGGDMLIKKTKKRLEKKAKKFEIRLAKKLFGG